VDARALCAPVVARPTRVINTTRGWAEPLECLLARTRDFRSCRIWFTRRSKHATIAWWSQHRRRVLYVTGTWN